MRADADFEGYVAARWPALIRTVVLLGCPVELAPDVVAAGLGSCRRNWRLATEQGDVDALALRAVVDAWAEWRRGQWWSKLPAESSGPDLSDLDRMTPDVRAGLVLRRFADLDAVQAAAVAGRAASARLPDAPTAQTLRELAESVAVYAPPEPATLVPARFRRRRLVQASIAVPVAAVVLGAWAHLVLNLDASFLADPDQETTGVRLDRVEPKRTPNPAEVAWYADDVLHLAHATYVLPTLRDLAVLGAGAVYGDTAGRVVHLADDGVRTLLGTKDPRVPFAASDSLGWVAWIDPAGANPRLLVYDVGQADIISELPLPASRSGPQEEPDTRPVAIDRQTVYFVTAEGARAWRPTRDPGFVEELDPPTLVDVSSANRMYQLDDQRIRLDQPFGTVVHDVPGRGGELSADGSFALTRSPEDGSVLVYDTRTGARVDVQPPEDLTVVDAVLAPAGAVTFLTIDPDGFATQDGSDSRPLQAELVTCQLDDGSCETLASTVVDSEAPILAR